VLGQRAESPGVAFLFLKLKDVIDLLDAEQAHTERQHADRVARVGPFPRFRQLLFGEPKPRSEEIDKRCDLNCEHRIASEKSPTTLSCRPSGLFHASPEYSFQTRSGVTVSPLSARTRKRIYRPVSMPRLNR